jgi:hypothetical protein
MTAEDQPLEDRTDDEVERMVRKAASGRYDATVEVGETDDRWLVTLHSDTGEIVKQAEHESRRAAFESMLAQLGVERLLDR